MNLIQTTLIGTIITTGLFTGGTSKDIDLKTAGENANFVHSQMIVQDYEMQKALNELNNELNELNVVMKKAELDKYNELQKTTGEQQKSRLRADLADLQKQGAKLVKLHHSIRNLKATSERMEKSVTLMLQSK